MSRSPAAVITKQVVFITLGALLLLALPLRLEAAGGQPPPGPVVLTDAQESYPLGRQLDLLADPPGTLTIDDVRSPENAGQFAHSSQEVPAFNGSAKAYWARVTLRNASSHPMWILGLTPYS